MTAMSFLREGIRNLKTVGTITRSSAYLCRQMISYIDFNEAEVIVELGAGDGVITRHILAKMRPDARLFVFEVNDHFCKILREIDDDRLMVIEDSAENLDVHLLKNGFTRVDHIISAIPFVVVPEDITYGILGQCKSQLKTGGKFIQVNYSLLKKKMYEKVFGNVRVGFVPFNLPPAFILVSEISVPVAQPQAG